MLEREELRRREVDETFEDELTEIVCVRAAIKFRRPKMTHSPAVRLTLLLLSTASALRAPLPRPTVRPVVFPELTSHPLMTVESPSAQSVEKAMNRVQDLGWTFAVAGWVVVGTAWFSIASIREMSSAQAAADVPVVLLAVVALLAAVESATAVPPGRAAESCELADPLDAESDEWVCDEHPDEASSLECEIDWASNKPAWRCR